jgi:Nif-specific regulatory protein
MDALNIIHECSTLLLAPQKSIRETLQNILELLRRRAGLRHGTITLLRPGTRHLVITAAHGLSPEELARGVYKLGEGVTGKVAAERKSAIVPNISSDPLFLDRTGIRREAGRLGVSFFCVPIVQDNDCLGTLSVDTPLDEEMSLEENLRLLEVLASMLGATLLRMRAHEEERLALRAENLRLREELGDRFDVKNLLGSCHSMQLVKQLVHKVAPSPTTVLIRGESGTGKELVAHAIHALSSRCKGPFIRVNCAALPESLIESELFGHERGAFTGATERRKGRFEAAHGGTLFLDEIGDVSMAVQVRLLRVLQEREFERVGGTETIPVDVRVVAATSSPLEEKVQCGSFREDLFYRLNVFPIFLPPLRERRSDVVMLVDHFLHKYAQLHNKPIKRITQSALQVIMAHRWPGNVRELENAIERAVILCEDEVIHRHHLPPSLQADKRGQHDEVEADSLEAQVASFERDLLAEALKESGGNATEAARLLKTTPRIVRYRAQKVGIDLDNFKRG